MSRITPYFLPFSCVFFILTGCGDDSSDDQNSGGEGPPVPTEIRDRTPTVPGSPNTPPIEPMMPMGGAGPTPAPEQPPMNGMTPEPEPEPEPEQPPSEPEPAPQAPPAEPPARAGECADVDGNDGCAVCACDQCENAVEMCYSDELCVAVVECARRTGCADLECVIASGTEINEAGGLFGGPVLAAKALGDCRDAQCANVCQ